MTKTLGSLGSLMAIAVFAVAGPAPVSAQQPTTAEAQQVVLRGAPIGKSARVDLATVVQNPQAYTRKPVVVEGMVDRACTNKGCWMQLAPAAGAPGVRVTFKDYAFFVPLNSAGMKARAEGVMVVKRHSKKDADHLEAEGAALTRNPDGTATEVSFVARGVELRP